MGIQRLLHSCCFLNKNTAITRQLIGTAITLEVEWWQVCGEAGMGSKKDESSSGGVRTAKLHHVTARSRLARVLKLGKRLFL